MDLTELNQVFEYAMEKVLKKEIDTEFGFKWRWRIKYKEQFLHEVESAMRERYSEIGKVGE